jgi:hypothetical protein
MNRPGFSGEPRILAQFGMFSPKQILATDSAGLPVRCCMRSLRAPSRPGSPSRQPIHPGIFNLILAHSGPG